MYLWVWAPYVCFKYTKFAGVVMDKVKFAELWSQVSAVFKRTMEASMEEDEVMRDKAEATYEEQMEVLLDTI